MRLALNSVLGFVFTAVGVYAGIVTWKLFGDTHSFVTVLVQDDREMRWDDPVWNDYLRYAVFYVPAVSCGTFAYLSCALGIWRLVRAIRSVASPGSMSS